MEEIEHKEPSMQLVESQEDLAKAMEKSDLFLRSHKTIENTNNWFIAVSAGTLLWIVTNFDKFYLEIDGKNELFLKYHFIAISLILLISLYFLIHNKIRLSLREYIMLSSIDSLLSLVNIILDLAKNGASGDELADHSNKGTNEIIQEYIRGHNLIDLAFPLLKTGIALYAIGFLAFTAYFIYFILNNR